MTESRGQALIVDDEAFFLEAIDEILSGAGFETVLAEDGESALAMARVERPALMLLDLGIPTLDGLEVCRRLRADPKPLRDLPILVVTGQTLSEERLLEAFLAGATDYLTKPVKPTLVRSRVRGWLLRTRPEAGAS